MTNEMNIEAYHAALTAGNTTEVLRLANLINWVAAVPTLVKAPRTGPAYYPSRLPAEGEFDAEGAILARQERDMMDY